MKCTTKKEKATKKNRKDNVVKTVEKIIKRKNVKPEEMGTQRLQKIKKRNFSKRKKQKDIQIIEEEKEPWSDLDLGNITDDEDIKKVNTPKKIPKMNQIHQGFKILKREKEFLNQLIPEDKKKAEHLLSVKKAIQKSQGQKVYTERALKKKLQRILKKKERSKKRWEAKIRGKK